MAREWAASGGVLAAALLCGAVGFGLLRLAHNHEAQIAAELTWPTTEGRLDELRIVPSGTMLREAFVVFAHYHYRVGDRDYTGHGVTGVPTSAARSYAETKRALAALVSAPGGERREEKTPRGSQFTYRPAEQPVRVAYDPQSPAQATIIVASPEPRLTGARILGWVAVGFGSLLAAIAFALFLGESDESRPRPTPAALPAPSATDLAAFTAAIDAVLAAIIQARRDPDCTVDWSEFEPSLVSLRTDPADALRRSPRLGYTRWMCGERSVEQGGPSARRVLDAIAALEAWHQAFRRQHLPQGEDQKARSQ